MGVGLGGQDCVNPRDAYLAARSQGMPVAPWLGKANEFVSPLGALPGRGWLLMRAEQLARLDFQAEHELTFSDHLSPVSLAKVHVIQAQCVLASSANEPGNLYLLEVSDPRGWIWHYSINRGYNLRDEGGNWITATLKDPGTQTPWTWAEVVEDLWQTYLGSTLLGKDFPGLPTLESPPVAYDDHPENLGYFGQSTLDALGSVLERLGLALRYDVVANTWEIVVTAAADDTYERQAEQALVRRTYDIYAQDSNRINIPGKVLVLFKKTSLTLDTHALSPYYGVTVALTDLDVFADTPTGVQAGTAVRLSDDLSAHMDAGSGSTTPTNDSQLQARAKHRARDFYEKVRDGLPVRQRVHEGSLAGSGLRPGAQVTATRWEDRGQGLRTEVIRTPVDDWLERWHPVEPQVPIIDDEIVEITGPKDGCYYPGSRLAFDKATCTWQEVELIWITDANDEGA